MTKKNTVALTVTVREALGRTVKEVRKTLMIPANIMGLNKPSQTITVANKDFIKHLEQEGESGLLYLQIADHKEQVPVLIEDIQRAPVNNSILHVVFRRVNLLEKVTADIPLEVVGELSIKNANIVVVTDTIEVEALPADLPENFTLDVSVITEVGQTLTIKDLSYDREKITILMTEEEKENPLVMAQEQREEEVEAPVEQAPSGGEAAAAEEAVPVEDSKE